MLEFGVRKVSLIEKDPTEKMGAVVIPQIHQRKYRVHTSFMSREGEMGET